MFGDRRSELDHDEMPEVALAKRRGLPLVWLIPLVAGVIAIWLGYTTLQEQGPTITITFKTADGLEPGKTKVMYKNVEMGLVDAVHLSEDLDRVIVTVEMDKTAAPHLRQGTQFWVVRPRVGLSGVSGLGTLVSGAFVEMDPGSGEAATEFVGIEVPPLVRSDDPGTRYVLKADELGSIARGSPILYRGINVGQVLGHELAEDERSVAIHVFVRSPHDRLVQDDSRFWNASGVDLSMGADGFQVSTASVEALMIGGIVFDTPLAVGPGTPAAAGTSFPLYPSRHSVTEATFTQAIPYLAQFDGSVRGLRPGAPVEFRGMRIGTVRSVSLEIDATAEAVRIPVVFEIEPQRVKVIGAEQMVPGKMMEALVRRGLRAQLKSGNLLTGELLIDLDFHPEAPPAEVALDGQYPTIPSVPSELDALAASVQGILGKLAALPLEGLIEDTQKAIRNVDALVTSSDTQATLRNLSQSAEDLRALLAAVDQRTGPLLGRAESTLAAAEGLIGADSQLRYDLGALLRELTGAARSIRVFADYLERHPEALVRGKGGQ